MGPVAERLLAQAEEMHMCAAPWKESDRQAMRRAVKNGRAISPAPGIYARADRWKELDAGEKIRQQMRALAALHPEWVFAGPSAGLVHGLWISANQLKRVHVSTSREAHAHESRGLARIVVSKDKAVQRDGLMVTSFLRTVYDCMRLSGFAQALAIADSAVRAKGITAERLVANLREGCRGLRDLGRVLKIASLADARSESGGESVARAAMMHLGVMMPDLQREVPDPLGSGKTYRVDFVWDMPDDVLVYGELDGKDKYLDPSMTKGATMADVLLAERRREAHITAGKQRVKVMRFSYAEVVDLREFEKLLGAYGIVPVIKPTGVATEWP